MSSSNGSSDTAALLSAYTKSCQDVSGPNANPRAKFIMDNLMKYLHIWAKEVDLSIDEWLAACDVMVKSGKKSDERRNEMILISDVLGLESLLDTMAHERAEKLAKQHGDAAAASTDTAILGPFYRENAPKYKHGDDIVQDHNIKDSEGSTGQTCYLFGKVTDIHGKPVEGAEIDVWHTAANGYYEQQDEKQPEYNNRGLFYSDAQGNYSLRCLVPTPYPIPYDSGAGDILKALDRSPMRPAHIHFLIKAKGYKTLVTQIFDRQCKYINSDAVFATKDNLVVDFIKPTKADAKTDTQLEYNLVLVPSSE